jgi:glycosyltransferase involved in cell wall biosynthesis
MKIGLNLLYLLPSQVGGTETYATELMRALDRTVEGDEFLVFLNSESANFHIPASPKFRKIICGVRANNRIKRYLFEQFVLPFLVSWYRVDILHSLGYVGPILLLQKHIITIHDANFVRLSWLMSPVKRRVYGLIARLSARTCNHIITISSFAKEELVNCLGVTSTKVTVVHHGVPLANEPAIGDGWLHGLAELQPYVLVLGGGSRHKNIRSFVASFARVQDCFPHKLVIAGHLSDSMGDLPEALELINSGRIIITGFLKDTDLDATYRGADLFVFPTLYEGFGLPILEAQARSVPVLCSRVASLPEIGGNSVAYFDPTSVDDMAEKLRDLLGSPEVMRDLVDRGHKNLLRFTWEHAASQICAIYKHILVQT